MPELVKWCLIGILFTSGFIVCTYALVKFLLGLGKLIYELVHDVIPCRLCARLFPDNLQELDFSPCPSCARYAELLRAVIEKITIVTAEMSAATIRVTAGETLNSEKGKEEDL